MYTFSFFNWKTYLGDFCICCTFSFFLSKVVSFLLLLVYKNMHCTSFFGKFMLFTSYVLFWVQSDCSSTQALWICSAFPIVIKCMDQNCLVVLVFGGKTNVEVNSRFLPREHWVQDGRPWASETTVYLLPCSKIKLCLYFTYFLASLTFVIRGSSYTSKKMGQTQNTVFFPKYACHLKCIWCLCHRKSKDKPS